MWAMKKHRGTFHRYYVNKQKYITKHFMCTIGTIKNMSWNILWILLEQHILHHGTSHKYTMHKNKDNYEYKKEWCTSKIKK
jgi:hypothetical protein